MHEHAVQPASLCIQSTDTGMPTQNQDRWSVTANFSAGFSLTSCLQEVFQSDFSSFRVNCAVCLSPYRRNIINTPRETSFQVSRKTPCSLSSLPSALCVWQEGKQASLAADFSVTQFKHLGRLLMVHGRNSYKRSAALSQFVIHRSLCISAMQVKDNLNLSVSLSQLILIKLGNFHKIIQMKRNVRSV